LEAVAVGGVARVGDALEASAALLGVQAATLVGVAGADHARVGVGAKVSEHAAFHGVASITSALGVIVARGTGCVHAATAVYTRINGTGITVVANLGHELASFVDIATVIGALAVVVTSNRCEHASARRIAGICSARVVIIANEWGNLTSTLFVAYSLVALVWRSAVGKRGVHATAGLSRGNFHTASIDGAVISVVTILLDDGRRAARLARALAGAAPVLISAVEREARGKLEPRIVGVPFAVEEVQTVVVALGQEGEVIQAHGFRRLRVEGTKVDHKLAINVHPQVIITKELEDLAAAVPEASVRLHAEAKVVLVSSNLVVGVVVTPITPALPIDGEEQVV
jgi:hypothetical protein